MADVCVIGAGPAGTTFATRMAQLGHRVQIIEQTRFPRAQLGESLSAGVMTLLRAADMHQTVEAVGFARVKSVWVKWADGLKLREDTGETGLLVDRGEFDRHLLERARAFGVQVWQPACVRAQIWDGAKWQMTIETNGQTQALCVDFLADARGRRSAPKRCTIRGGPSTLAIYAYWRGTSQHGSPRIEAGADAWYWGVPLPDGRYNTLLFMDPAAFRSTAGANITERFLTMIQRSGLLEGFGDAQLASPVRAIDATAYLASDYIGPARIRLGDAAIALDPISSTGVQKALQTALSGAIVANTLLRRPRLADAAQSFYTSQLSEASARHQRWAGAYYNDGARAYDRPFWRDRAMAHTALPMAPPAPSDVRALASKPVALSSALQFVQTPCLQGDFVRFAQALHHPGLDSPLIYLGGQELSPLLRGLEPGRTPLQIARLWQTQMPLESGMAIVDWLISHGILVGQASQLGALT